MIYGILIYLFLCYVVADMAKDKELGKSFAFVLSIFLTPLCGLVAIWLSTPKVKDISIFEVYHRFALRYEFQGDNTEAIRYYKECLFLLFKVPEEIPRNVDIHQQKIKIRNAIARLGGEVPKAYYEKATE